MANLYKVIEAEDGIQFYTDLDAEVAAGHTVIAPKEGDPGLSAEEATAICRTVTNLMRMTLKTAEQVSADPRQAALMFQIMYNDQFGE